MHIYAFKQSFNVQLYVIIMLPIIFYACVNDYFTTTAVYKKHEKKLTFNAMYGITRKDEYKQPLDT